MSSESQAVAAEADEPAAGADDPGAGHPQPGGERIRTLDFSQPTKFTPELRHRIARAIDQLCQALNGRLAIELKTEVELSVAEVGQQTWAAAKARLPADSIAIAVREGQSAERQMLLGVEPLLVLQALECLLGGEASQAPDDRRLSEVDWALANGLLDLIVAELSAAWAELGAAELTRGEVDMEGDAGVLMALGEPTFTVKLASTIDGQSSELSLLIPWAAVEPLAESARGAGAQPSRADVVNGPDALRRGLAAAQVLLRAEVGSVQMPIERMLELQPGALVELNGRAEDGVLVFVEGVSLGRGHAGRAGARRAIKLESTSEPPLRADTYAKLGPGELERARSHLTGARDHENPEIRPILGSIFVRVWAELGGAYIPLSGALELAPGAVVELDRRADDPVELFVNGLCFANGSLVVTAEGAWGVQVRELLR
jgi:flagellar motor switch protein FliM